MKAVRAALVFATLIGVATCLFQRKYILVGKPLTWTNAQEYCKLNYVDLLTITSAEDISVLGENLERSWIGLRKNPQEVVYTEWSDGTKLTFTAWKPSEPKNLARYHCVTLFNSKFVNYDCSTPLPFYCYTWSPAMIVVQEMMNWEEALKYCRTYYTDLVSATTETDWGAIKNSLQNQNTSVWTGLRFMNGLWFWVNLNTLENRTSLLSCPVRPFHCGVLTTEMVLMSRNCNEKMNFICYT